MKMSNNKYFISMWLGILLISLFPIMGFLNGLKEGSWSEVIFMPISILFVLWLMFMKRRDQMKVIEKVLQSDSPDALIAAITKPLKLLRDKQLRESMIGYNEALANLFYGKKETASLIMDQINWEDKVPYYQSFKSLIAAFGNYFYEENNYEGLASLRKAKALATSSSMFPGMKAEIEGYDDFIAIGQILNGITNSEAINRLEERFANKKTPLLVKLIISWGLANAYVQLKLDAKAEEMLAFCKQKAPHSTVLHEVKPRFSFKWAD